MTVVELIKLLEQWPPQSIVRVEGDGLATGVDWFYEGPTRFGIIIHDYPIGESKNDQG